MPPKRIELVEGQVGLSDVEPEFSVAEAVSRKSKVFVPTSQLDLTKRPQTWLKLLSLSHYLPVWFVKISNVAEEAYYIDFFAGPGVYAGPSQTAKGSPVLACEAAAAIVDLHSSRGRVWTPHLRFVEPDTETRATLAAELARFSGVIDYEIIAETADRALPRLLAESAGKPTLAFFDPFGYRDVDFEYIAAFARPGINEVLVNFDAAGIERNVAAGNVDGITAFSGGEWWLAHAHRQYIDLQGYLRGLAAQYRRRGFPYAGVQLFEYMSNHARRAVLQCCGSKVGRAAWLDAVRKSRGEMQLIDDIFPELDEHVLVNAVITRLGSAVGESLIHREIIARLDDLEWTERSVDEALGFLREAEYLSTSDRVGSSGRPYTLYRLKGPWPTNLSWDGITRAGRPRRSLRRAPSGS